MDKSLFLPSITMVGQRKKRSQTRCLLYNSATAVSTGSVTQSGQCQCPKLSWPDYFQKNQESFLSLLSFLNKKWRCAIWRKIRTFAKNRIFPPFICNFVHLLFGFVLMIESMKLNGTKCITWPISRHNFRLLWPKLVKCVDRANMPYI